jgi:hypothetical protein
MLETREIDSVVVVGKTKPQRIFELLGRKGEVAREQLALRDAYVEALAAYRRKDWEKALAGFEDCLTIASSNRRFSRMCGHYLIEPTACTPASGWEKGQVENQVGVVRERFFTPRLRVASYEKLNAWLLDRCVAYAKAHKHPELTDRTIWQAFEAERPQLVQITGRFDGFHATQASVSKTCLVRFDNNKYSVASRAVGRPVEIQAYSDHVVIRQDGTIVGEHRRRFGRGATIYDPWHYVPVLARKPGALRNGAPFKAWLLPASLERVRRMLKGSDDGDRQMVKVLAAVLTDGLAAVEAACAEALADVVLNILSRHRDPEPAATILTPDALRLQHAPIADCARYDGLRSAS